MGLFLMVCDFIDNLLVVIAALAAVVVILVMGAIVIAVVYARSRLSLGIKQHKVMIIILWTHRITQESGQREC